MPDRQINDLVDWEGVYEFPITVFKERTGLRAPRLKPLDINGVSFAEMKSVLQFASDNGPRNVTIILHSFSFIKPYDVQYNRVRLRYNVIRRFEKLCRFLADNEDKFNVLTFGSLEAAPLQEQLAETCHRVPSVPMHKSLFRLGEQLVDSFV